MVSYNGALVLQAIAQGNVYGFDMMRATALGAGTVYPLLRRLEASGLVRSSWEDDSKAHSKGRPARRYYRMTSQGEAALALALERIRAQQRLFESPDEADAV